MVQRVFQIALQALVGCEQDFRLRKRLGADGRGDLQAVALGFLRCGQLRLQLRLAGAEPLLQLFQAADLVAQQQALAQQLALDAVDIGPLPVPVFPEKRAAEQPALFARRAAAALDRKSVV